MVGDVDSARDRTGELALASSARVLKTPKRGLGRAYLDVLLTFTLTPLLHSTVVAVRRRKP